MSLRFGILTVSDAGSRSERTDTSGPALAELVVGDGGEVARQGIVPDDRQLIAQTLCAWCDGGDLDVILTTGGTGLAPRDVTPEATLDVADRVVPGIAEAMRAEGTRATPMAMLGRGVAVTRGRTLIVNVPGSEKAARESYATIAPVLTHAAQLLHGDTEHR
jgi:molybdopterin adenylyltransferase